MFRRHQKCQSSRTVHHPNFELIVQQVKSDNSRSFEGQFKCTYYNYCMRLKAPNLPLRYNVSNVLSSVNFESVFVFLFLFLLIYKDSRSALVKVDLNLMFLS